MFGLDQFNFSELWSPWMMVSIIIIAVLYLILVGPMRTKFPGSTPVSFSRKFLFLLGLFLYYMAQGGPLNLLAHLMFSAHMVGMAVAFLIAPPLMLLGIPGWLVRSFVMHPRVKPVYQFLTHPLVTVIAFNALFSFYHMPAVHDYVMTHFTVHRIYYGALLFTAFMMWWPIIAPLPETARLSELRKIAYVFANGILITPACALIIFADTPMYQTFNDPYAWAQALGYCVPRGSEEILRTLVSPGQFMLFSPLEDQQLGGVLMKVIQEIVYGAALAYVFFKWYIHEKKDDMNPDPILQ